MPITRTVTKQVTKTLTLLTLQEYADATVAEQYRQPLKTIEEALSVHGWLDGPMPDEFRPVCCEEKTECKSFLGGAYLAVCKKCGNFVYDITAPTFGNSYVTFPDGEKIDLETDIEHRWIAGTGLKERGSDA